MSTVVISTFLTLSLAGIVSAETCIADARPFYAGGNR